jgi:hypothetical protein
MFRTMQGPSVSGVSVKLKKQMTTYLNLTELHIYDILRYIDNVDLGIIFYVTRVPSRTIIFSNF